jgi:hypothetical protein
MIFNSAELYVKSPFFSFFMPKIAKLTPCCYDEPRLLLYFSCSGKVSEQSETFFFSSTPPTSRAWLLGRNVQAVKSQKPSVSIKVIDDIDEKGARFLSSTPLEQICAQLV